MSECNCDEDCTPEKNYINGQWQHAPVRTRIHVSTDYDKHEDNMLVFFGPNIVLEKYIDDKLVQAKFVGGVIGREQDVEEFKNDDEYELFKAMRALDAAIAAFVEKKSTY